MNDLELLKHIEQISHTFCRQDFPALEKVDRDLQNLLAAGYIDEVEGEAFLRKFGTSENGGADHLVLVIVRYGLSSAGKKYLARPAAESQPRPRAAA